MHHTVHLNSVLLGFCGMPKPDQVVEEVAIMSI